MGSDRAEREYAYQLDAARNSFTSHRFQWFENERRRSITREAYWIDRNLVSNKDYQVFVNATGHAAPGIDPSTWNGYRLVHPYDTARRFIWHNNKYPVGRSDHPVVLVDRASAGSYCRWRGNHGQYFPWGNKFDADKLNSADKGPYDSDNRLRYDSGASPYGVLNMAGIVFKWTATACSNIDRPHTSIVKGGSWDDFPGATHAAVRHCRRHHLKPVLIGFRCTASTLRHTLKRCKRLFF